jgi:hypothetical protein
MVPQFQTEFVIEKLEYFPVAKHNPMYMRPYMFNVQQEAVSTLADRLDESKAGRVTPGILQGVTSGIIQPSAVGYDTVINNDWVSTRRYLFMMKVRHTDFSGMEHNNYIIGYTEYDGILPNGHIDHKLSHYINNVISTYVAVHPTPFGLQRVEKLHSTVDAVYSMNQTDVYTQRPVDLYQEIAAQDVMNFSGIPADICYAGSLVNPFNNNVVSSTSENSITSEYLSKLLTSGMHAARSKEVHMNSYSMGNDDPTEKFFVEPSLNDVAFIKRLSQMAGYKTVRPVFEFATLQHMDPTIYQRFTLYNITDEIRDPLMAQTPEVGEYWNGRDMITTKAYSLIESCVSLASKYGFTKFSFQATNTDNPAIPKASVYVLSFKSFLSLGEQDMHMMLEIFKEKFILEIFLGETNAGRVPMNMECHINIHGTTKLYLEWAGYPGTWYTIPTFAGSSFSPILSIDRNAVSASAHQLNNVLNTLVQAQQPSFY